MKKFSLLIVLAMLIVAVVPASAQLGDTDISSFTVQNVDTETATVTIHFYAEDGTVITPSVLNSSQPNPFDLLPGESWEVYLPAIDDTQLADGRYSVVIEFLSPCCHHRQPDWPGRHLLQRLLLRFRWRR